MQSRTFYSKLHSGHVIGLINRSFTLFYIYLVPAHVRRFGPAMLFATEAFESFNAVIRAKSIHSNRQAPSRDIAMAFAQGNRVRHLLSGGYFVPAYPLSTMLPKPEMLVHANWHSVGPGPLRLIESDQTVQNYLGLSAFGETMALGISISFTHYHCLES